MVTVYVDSVREQRGRDHFTLESVERFTVEGEWDLGTLGYVEDRMAFYAVLIGHNIFLFRADRLSAVLQAGCLRYVIYKAACATVVIKLPVLRCCYLLSS